MVVIPLRSSLRVPCTESLDAKAKNLRNGEMQVPETEEEKEDRSNGEEDADLVSYERTLKHCFLERIGSILF
ncbi:hypothetical protein VNO77_00237 [Canavalia gladiata]|uniref:Uncharacterized protein n=1 Tax=Canavalia gladiata TaxID=3824 RepID=A0AAN9R159_CANGL